MKKSTDNLIDQIGDRVLTMPIGILWKSQALAAGAGERRSLSRGSDGYEIASRQQYEVGDDPRSIDHFATAQSGDDSIITISYEEPNDIKVVALVNVGRRMHFGTRRADKLTVAAELAASILACAAKTQDPSIVTTYSELRIESSIGPRGAKSIFALALESILEPRPSDANSAGSVRSAADGKSIGAASETPHKNSNMVSRGWEKLISSGAPSSSTSVKQKSSGLYEALSELPRNRALVFVVSDFIDLSKKEKEALSDAAAVHDVVCVVIQDLRERELPAGRGMYTLRDIVSGDAKTVWLNDTNRDLFRRNAQQRLDDLAAFFKTANCDWGLFSTEQNADEVIPEMMRLFGGHRR